MKRNLILFLALNLSCSVENQEEFVSVREPETILIEPQTPVNYALTVSAGTGGSVSPTSGTFESGTEITITATPNIGFMFVGWSGTSSGFNPSLIINISQNTSLTATFEPLIYLEENGITIKAKPESSIGLTEFNGQTFEIIGENKLREMVNNGEDLSRVITSKVNNMDDLFSDLNDITDINGDISHWDVSNVLYMRRMFRGITFNPPIANWDTSSLLYADQMFYNSEFNLDISQWNTGNLISTAQMFFFSPFNQPLNDWDVSNVTNMFRMFGDTPFNHPLNDWDVSNVTNMNQMFGFSKFNQNISAWDVSNVTNMLAMFYFSPFNQPLNDWDVSNVTKMDSMFLVTPFNQDISNWDVSNVTSMSGMFQTTPFNQDISAWDVSNVTDMENIFSFVSTDYTFLFNDSELSNFNQDLSSWDVSNVIKCANFYTCANTVWTLSKPNFTKCLGPLCSQ